MLARRLVLLGALAILLCLTSLSQAPQPAIEQIQSLIDRGDYRPALDAVNRLIAQSPRHSEAYRLRANARRNLDDLAGALEDANKAVELDPSNARALGGRSIVKRLLKDPGGALADVNRALAVQPGYHQGYDARALLKEESGDLAGALSDANRAIELSPQAPNYFIRRSTVRRGLKDLAGAERDITKAIELAPTNPHAYFERALVRLEQKRWAEVISDNTRALDLKLPNAASALNNRALGYKNRGMLAEARRDLDQAVKLQPEHSLAASNLARLDKPPAAPVPAPAPAATGPAGQSSKSGSTAPEGGLDFLHRGNFFRMTCSGSILSLRADGTTASIDLPIGGFARIGFPVQWSGDEFFYSGPSFDFDPKRHPSTETGGNIRLQAGSHLALGKLSPDGNRVVSLRLLTRGDNDYVFAIELRDIELRNRQQNFDSDTLFLSNYSQQAAYTTAAEMFKSTVRILCLSGNPQLSLLEYRPFGLSVSLFNDPAVPSSYRSKEALPAVRTRIEKYWTSPASWARVIALSEARLHALFPGRSTAPR